MQKIFENFNKKKSELTEKIPKAREEKTENVAHASANQEQAEEICVEQPNETNATVNATNVVRNIATSVIKFVGRSQDIQPCKPGEDKIEHLKTAQTSFAARDDPASAASCEVKQMEQKVPCVVSNTEASTIDTISEIGVNLPSLELLNYDQFPDIRPLPLLNTNTNLTVYRQLLSPYLKKSENVNEVTRKKEPSATQAEALPAQLVIDRPPKKMIEKYDIFRN